MARNRIWQEHEDNELKRLKKIGFSSREIGKRLGRSQSAIHSRVSQVINGKGKPSKRERRSSWKELSAIPRIGATYWIKPRKSQLPVPPIPAKFTCDSLCTGKRTFYIFRSVNGGYRLCLDLWEIEENYVVRLAKSGECTNG